MNCTPHSIVIRNADGADTTIAPCGTVPRVIGETRDGTPVAGIPVKIDGVGTVEGLPNPEPGVVYIVSGMVLSALAGSDRVDVFAPGTGPTDGAIRNAAGHIIAVTCLKGVAPKPVRLADAVANDFIRKIAGQIASLRRIAVWEERAEGAFSCDIEHVANQLETLIK
jgi:hypothetical protein